MLPESLTEINEYICGPLNRKIEFGFAPAIGQPSHLSLEFVPITVFHFTIVLVEISVVLSLLCCSVSYQQHCLQVENGYIILWD